VQIGNRKGDPRAPPSPRLAFISRRFGSVPPPPQGGGRFRTTTSCCVLCAHEPSVLGCFLAPDGGSTGRRFSPAGEPFVGVGRERGSAAACGRWRARGGRYGG
jgi:hypothetical protein